VASAQPVKARFWHGIAWPPQALPRCGLDFFGAPFLAIPLWPLIVAVAAAGTVLSWRRRPRAGHCAACGYDLTGNTSGICPECGVPIETKPMEAV
jgi:hypothetical protein